MKIKRKYLKFFTLSILVISICFMVFTIPTFADVGNTFDGGGSSGGSSGGGFGGSFGSVFYMMGFFGNNPFLFAVLVIAVVVICGRKHLSGGQTTNQSNPYPPTNNNIVVDEDLVVSKVRELDPSFSSEQFKAYASEVYLSLQEAWEQRNWNSVRSFESNLLFNIHNRQLQEYLDTKKTNHLDRQNIRNIAITNFKIDGTNEVITLKLDASLLDYVTDDTSGKIVEGSNTVHQHRSYCLEFIRTCGVKTNTSKEVNTTNCPNCGAPIKVTSSGECEYCKSIITSGEYGWVLNKYSAW